MKPCPTCNLRLEGLATYCPRCDAYTADMVGATTDSTPASRRPGKAVKDTRDEDTRKADALPTILSLGWIVYDTEQGFRPFTCRHCGGNIAGGTRTTLGFPDWVVQGYGHIVFMEWKSGTGKQTDEQKAVEADCRKAGTPYFLVRTTEEAVAALEPYRKGRNA